MIYINKDKISKFNLTKGNYYVAMDFDKTITAKDSCDSWDASGRKLGEEFKSKLNALYEIYAPIELDYTIGFEKKNKAMEEWYGRCMNLYYENHLTKQKLEESIEISNLFFRKGAEELLKELHENSIPVVILSAGIGNVIEKFLQKNNCLYDNMNIISNFIKFDENGNMIKYDNPIIHTLNKTLEGHANSRINRMIDGKEFRLLFGDFIEDKNIIPQKEWNNTLSVGFLNKNIENNMEIYKKSFDVVLTNEDATFDVAKNIVFN